MTILSTTVTPTTAYWGDTVTLTVEVSETISDSHLAMWIIDFDETTDSLTPIWQLIVQGRVIYDEWASFSSKTDMSSTVQIDESMLEAHTLTFILSQSSSTGISISDNPELFTIGDPINVSFKMHLYDKVKKLGRQWFYLKDEINTLLSGKVDKSNGASQMTDSSAYSNLGTSANATQTAINSAIDTAIGDLGVGSFTELQSLITNASSGDTIILDRDYKNTGSEAQITIDKTLTIIGNGHTIDADNVSRCVLISASDVVLTGLYFTNGNATVYDSNKHGGGVYCPSGNGVSIVDCHFSDCSATYYGGGAYLYDSTLSDSSFTDCSTTNFGGGAYLYDSTLSDSSFTDCSATDYGGGAFLDSSNTVSDCSFTDCSAQFGSGVALFTSTLSDCSFNNCSASRGGGAFLGSSTVYDSIFNDCTATQDGGGIYSTDAVTLYGNTLTNSTLYNVTNIALSDIDTEIGSLNNSITNLCKIYYIERNTSSTVSANGGTASFTVTVPSLPTGYSYIIVERKGANGRLYNDSLNGTTLTLTAQNLRTSAQTVYVRVYLIYVPTSWIKSL